MNTPFKSIRWRIQAWHGVILLTVLTAFGYTAFFLAQDNSMRRVDQQLQERMAALANALPPPMAPGRFRTGMRVELGIPGPRPGPGGTFELRLRPEEESLFDESKTGAFYYAVESPGDRVLSRSANAPEAIPLAHDNDPSPSGEFRLRGELRELVRTTPQGLALVVGTSVGPVLTDQRRLAGLLAACGGGVLVLGLAGGWWLSHRAIRPIEAISSTARRIAVGNLSERIGVSDTESELGQLAQVLNGTFDRLQAAFARQAQFTADASHELRTPVSVVLSQTQTALKRERPSPEYREALAVCQNAAQRMRRLVESLLILARQDSGETKATRSLCDLARVTTESIELFRPLIREQGTDLRTELEESMTLADAEQLGQVVANLIGNAIQHNPPRGRVEVSVRPIKSQVVLTVRDNGTGIASEDLPHIFERFYRADKSRSRARGHAGLGLAICKAIVEAHHGNIEVSVHCGSGSTFTVRLPAAKAEVE